MLDALFESRIQHSGEQDDVYVTNDIEVKRRSSCIPRVAFVDTNLVLFKCKLADQKSTLAQFLLCHWKSLDVLCIRIFTVRFLYLKNVEVAVKIDDKMLI